MSWVEYAAARLRGGTPAGFRLDDYKRWFPLTSKLFLRQLKQSGVFPPADRRRGRPVGVVVVPWVSTPVAWYAIMLGVGLARRGRNVVFLWDDTGFPELHLEEQNAAIARVLRYVGRYLPVRKLSSEQLDPGSPQDAALVEKFTAQNVTWIVRGAPITEDDRPLTERVRASLSHSLPFIRAALEGADLEYLVVPGGVYGTSGLFRQEAEALGCRVATFDTDRRIGQLCVSGVAAQNADIPRAFDALWASGAEARRDAIRVATTEFQSRMENRDGYGFQALAATGGQQTFPDSVLMPLNVEWDTAALGRHIHFRDTGEWLTATITAILESDSGPVVVRQHPSERRKLQRSKLDIGSLLHDRFGGDGRVHFVAAEDSISSYDLLRSARLVLPFVSTIAIEAAAIGKPVLISGASYFADLGFVWSAGSRDEYFALLHRGLRGELPLWPDQADRAWVCYYLTAVRNRIPTDFTPHPEDFWDWCRRHPDALFADPEVADILTAIDRNEPVSWLRHCRLSEQAPPAGPHATEEPAHADLP